MNQVDHSFHRKMAETCYDAAMESIGDGDFEDALDKLDDALSCQSDFLPALLKRTEICLDFDELELARQDVQTILKLYPDSMEGLLLAGNLYRAQGDLTKAIAAYDRVIETNNKNHVAFYARAVTYDLLEETAKALLDFDRCLQLAPDFVSAWYDRGVLYACEKNWSAAESDYSRAIELDSEFVQAYVTRGDARALNGNFKGAEDDFQKAIDLDPDDGMAYYYRGVMYSACGNPKKAQIDFDEAKKRNFDPQD